MRRTMAEPTIKPSATGASSFTCSGGLMPKPMDTGSVGLLAQPGDVVEQFRRQIAAFAGNACDRDVIDEAGRCFGNPQGPLARRGGRDQLDQTEIGLTADFGQRRRFLDQQIGHDRPGHSGACMSSTYRWSPWR